jgi:predicted small secreted protein
MSEQFSRTAQLTLSALFLAGMVATLGGCQTWKGLGKDVTGMGDSMQGDKDADSESDESKNEDDG